MAMAKIAKARRRGVKSALPDEVLLASVDPGAALAALPSPVLVIGAGGRIASVNPAAEQFLQSSRSVLVGTRLDAVLPADSPLFALLSQSRTAQTSISEYDVSIETARIGSRVVMVEVAPLAEQGDAMVVYLHEQSIARKMGQQLTHRNAARSVTAMALMLAHEVKNPLSGIRGAAQLLEQTVEESDRELTQLIRDETDRIVKLVERMEVFADNRPIQRTAVNIHEVLEHVRRIAQNGFAKGVRFVELYDPSLPAVWGNRDLLVQAFLNLVKNAAEAVSAETGEIQIHTAYQQGVRLAVPGTDVRHHLPLTVSIRDNGPGIPIDLQPHLFDPFVTTKPNGKGLGLALVAKAIGDHGGVIEFDSQPRRTVFRAMLPMVPGGAPAET